MNSVRKPESRIKEFALSSNYRSSERIISYFSNYTAYTLAKSPVLKDAKFPSRITYNQKVTRSNVHDEIVRLIRKSSRQRLLPPEKHPASRRSTVGLLAHDSGKLVAMLPDQQFDGSSLIPFSNNSDNFWFKVSKVLLDGILPQHYFIRRPRCWATK